MSTPTGISYHAITVVFDPDYRPKMGTVTTYDHDGSYRVAVVQPGPFDTCDDLWQVCWDGLDQQLTLWEDADGSTFG